MSAYTERVAHNLKGCEHVSTGVCPGCDECRAAFDAYRVQEHDGPDAVEYGFKADTEWRSFATEAEAEAASRECFADDVASGSAFGEGEFSWSECDVCGSRLGGTREVWHYVDARGRLQHGEGACVDCVMYLANGDEPEAQ